MIARNPRPSVMLAFGLGFGVGVLVTLALAQDDESWFDRNMRRPLLDLPDRLRRMHLPEGIARRMP
jgi:hypothetical protein